LRDDGENLNGMKKVLITGGTGFIGSRLALDCARRGERVCVLALRNTPAEVQNCCQLEEQGISIVEGSVTNSETAIRACEGMEVVYHLAAAQHEVNVPDQHYYDVNVEGTRNMLHAAARTGVERFVHGSTIGVYGIDTHGPVRDDSPLNPDNIYGITKLEGEKVVRQFFARVPSAILRISETYGPGDRRLLKLFDGIQKRRFFHIGNGRNLHHLVYIDDLIAGFHLAAAAPAAVGNTFVLAGPVAVTTEEMIASICRAANVDLPRLHMPLWPLMTTAAIMEGLMRPFGLQPPLHRRRMNFFVKSFQFTCEPARRFLGYDPKVGVEKGIRRTYEWYQQMNLLPWLNGPVRLSTGSSPMSVGNPCGPGDTAIRIPARTAEHPVQLSVAVSGEPITGDGAAGLPLAIEPESVAWRGGLAASHECRASSAFTPSGTIDMPTGVCSWGGDVQPGDDQGGHEHISSSGAATNLAARLERFDSFWEGPEDIERGYGTLGQFYRVNYLKHVPADRRSRILVISCGPGYFVNLLSLEGYTNVVGIDSHAEKIAPAIRRGLNCQTATAFEHLQNSREPYDVIICEQELNHLTKQEMVAFLQLVWRRLSQGGTLICHGLNGANPIVGAETLAQNFDHFNTFTSYSLRQVLEHTGFKSIRVFGLHLYVFYRNPMNYVAWAVSSTLAVLFRALFVMYGKTNRIFTKKIAAVAIKG